VWVLTVPKYIYIRLIVKLTTLQVLVFEVYGAE
jgi:hypothetical protein